MNDAERIKLASHRLNKAKETLGEIDILIDNNLWNTAVNRLYYACYYAVKALLVKSDIEAETHAGVRQMFGLHFVKTGMIDKETAKIYSDIFDRRLIGDYQDFVEYTRDDVKDLKKPVEKLIRDIEELLKEDV